MSKRLFLAAVAMVSAAWSQDQIPVSMTVNVEAASGKPLPELHREDISAYQGKQRLTVTDWARLADRPAGQELYILIDDASASSLGNQLADLRQFIGAQPATTLIGAGYMQNGSAVIKQSLTSDHGKVAAALRLPLGTIAAGASPFLSLSDLIKKWPASGAGRDVLMISSGIDPLGGLGSVDPYLDATISDAQRAGVIVYAVYTPAAGHGGHSRFRMLWGQNHLAELAEETGGESYMLGFGAPVSFAPYLNDVAAHLAHQYLVTFLIKPPKKPDFIAVRFATEAPGVEIVAAPRVYAPQAPGPSGGR